MPLLDYSTTENPNDRLPVMNESPKSWKLWKIGLCTFVAASLVGAAIFGIVLNFQIGLLLTAIACIPLAVLITITLFISPRSEVSLPLRLIAIIWGGVGATNLTLSIVGKLTALFGQPDLNTTVVVQAAIVEEFSKGIFLFALYFFFKKLIRTPLGGAVLGIMVGAGFAFIENIMYFNNAYLQGGWDSLWATVLLRAVMSFFLHGMATMFTGMFIGYIVQNRTKLRFWKKAIFVEMGLLSAMTVHGMWNGMASLTTDNSKWNMLYLFFWIPFVALMTFVIFQVRKNYLAYKETTFLESARSGYIKMEQAERISDTDSRKLLYKESEALDVIQWEASLLRIQHWNDSIALAKKEKRIKKLNKAKSKDMLKLAQVITKV